jgi:hypothetical protein
MLQKDGECPWKTEAMKGMASSSGDLCNASELKTVKRRNRIRQIVMDDVPSLEGQRAIVQQGDEKRDCPLSCCKSQRQNKAEKPNDTGKHECHGLIKVLNRFHNHVDGVRFFILTDTHIVAQQLIYPANQKPQASDTCWIAWIPD